MRVDKLMVTSAAIAAFAAGGCGNERPDNVPRVGDDDWVHLTEAASNANVEFGAGEECLVVRGADLILRKGGVLYNRDAEPELKDEGPAGTECPNGAKLNMTPSEVAEQNRKYQAFVRRREEVTDQVEAMDNDVDGAKARLSPPPRDLG